MQLVQQIKENKWKGKCLQFIATLCMGPVSFGALVAWTSPVLPQLQQGGSTSLNLTIEEGSWIGAMMAIGALSSALPAGILADHFGPKKCIIAFSMPVLVFAVLAIIANNVYVVCLARVFSGVAIGGVSVVAPVYISEIAEPSLRGTLGSFFEFLIYVGVVKTAVFGAYVSYTTLTTIIGAVSLALSMCFFFFPESPFYLMKIKAKSKAESALQFYRGNDFNVGDVLDQIDIIRNNKSSIQTNIFHVLSSKSVIRGLVVCVGLTVFQQLCAIDAIIYYNVQIFQKAAAALDAYTSSIIMSVVQLLSATLAVLIIERANRRTFLYISSVGTCISLAFMGIYFHLQMYKIEFTGIGIIPLTSMVVYNIAFALGLGPIPWMVNGEMFGSEIKGVANGITIITNWAFLFIITKTFPIMLLNFGSHYTFYMYSGCMVLCTIFIKFCVFETKGKTLQQIQEELNS